MRAGWLFLTAALVLAGCKLFQPRSAPSPVARVQQTSMIGQAAPELQGEDVDGNALRLSDFRGRVVVLHFWGHWWSACRSYYAHERSLVEKYQAQPVAFVGVNSDGDQAAAKQLIERERLSPATFWVEDTENPVHERFHVRAWPKTYVLDARGVIRFEPHFPEEIDQAVQTLLSEPVTHSTVSR